MYRMWITIAAAGKYAKAPSGLIGKGLQFFVNWYYASIHKFAF